MTSSFFFLVLTQFFSPCHSLILDNGDQCWETVFTKEDLKEIKTFKLKRLPNLPTDLENYFNSLLLLSTENDLDKLYTDVKAANFHPRNDEALAWAQNNCSKYDQALYVQLFPSQWSIWSGYPTPYLVINRHCIWLFCNQIKKVFLFFCFIDNFINYYSKWGEIK